MTLRQIGIRIRDILRENSQDLECPVERIDFGKSGFPSEAPFIWIYPEVIPDNVLRVSAINQAKFTIFCGVSTSEPGQTMFDAIEFAEKCMLKIFDDEPFMFHNSNYGYYSAYSDYAVGYVELTGEYTLTGATE